MASSCVATQWTTPTTAAQRPWIMWCDWVDLISYIDVKSIKISDPGGNSPAVMTFTAIDRTNVVGGLLAKQMRVMFVETQAAAGAGQILFHGFIKFIKPIIVATYARWEVTCTDVSEYLDFSLPIESMARPAESDSARIGAILGTYSTWSGLLGGGFVQTLNGALGPTTFGKATVRTAIEDTLGQTGSQPVGYYVDFIGPWLHSYASADAGAAPYAISDTPNYATTIPAKIEVEYDGSMDTDGVYVFGGTKAGTGTVMSSPAPRYPTRMLGVDEADSLDAATRAYVGKVDLDNAQNVLRATITVTGDQQHGNFGGWAKGQSLAVTNAVLGWVAKPLVIMGVDMRFRNGVGTREYVLTCSDRPVAKLNAWARLRAALNVSQRRLVPGVSLGGRVGSAPSS